MLLLLTDPTTGKQRYKHHHLLSLKLHQASEASSLSRIAKFWHWREKKARARPKEMLNRRWASHRTLYRFQQTSAWARRSRRDGKSTWRGCMKTEEAFSSRFFKTKEVGLQKQNRNECLKSPHGKKTQQESINTESHDSHLSRQPIKSRADLKSTKWGRKR